MGSLFDDTVVFSSSSSFSSPLLSFPVPDYFDVLRPLHFPGSLAQTLQLEQSAFRVNPQKVLFVLRFAGSCRLGERKNTKKMSKSRGKKNAPTATWHVPANPRSQLSVHCTVHIMLRFIGRWCDQLEYRRIISFLSTSNEI